MSFDSVHVILGLPSFWDLHDTRFSECLAYAVLALNFGNSEFIPASEACGLLATVSQLC